MAENPSEPTELVYLPSPSWRPALTALGLALVVAGLFVWWPYAVVGAAIALVAIVGWIRDAARGTSRLRVEQRPAAAVLPAVPLRRPDGNARDRRE